MSLVRNHSLSPSCTVSNYITLNRFITVPNPFCFQRVQHFSSIKLHVGKFDWREMMSRVSRKIIHGDIWLAIFFELGCQFVKRNRRSYHRDSLGQTRMDHLSSVGGVRWLFVLFLFFSSSFLFRAGFGRFLLAFTGRSI